MEELEELLKELKKNYNKDMILFMPEFGSPDRKSFYIIPSIKLPTSYLKESFNNYVTINDAIKIIHSLVKIKGTSGFKLNKLFGNNILNLQFLYDNCLEHNYGYNYEYSSNYILNITIRYNCSKLAILLSMTDLLDSEDKYLGKLTFDDFISSDILKNTINLLLEEELK